MTSTDQTQTFWYKRFRGASYASMIASLVWTILIILPFRPFSYLPPIVVGGGAGVWFVLAYILLLTLGVGGYGTLSSLLSTIELQEKRSVGWMSMSLAFVLLGIGFVTSFVLLAVGGAVGGYAATIAGESGQPIDQQLGAYVYPITFSALTAVVGAALTVVALIRAR